MLATDEVDACIGEPPEPGESPFAWEFRAMAVSAALTPPGVLLGALVRLFVNDGGPSSAWLICGGILGAIAGGLLEGTVQGSLNDW